MSVHGGPRWHGPHPEGTTISLRPVERDPSDSPQMRTVSVTSICLTRQRVAFATLTVNSEAWAAGDGRSGSSLISFTQGG